MKPVLFVIMDGVGFSKTGLGDAVSLANTPTLDHFLKTYPNVRVKAHGPAVGLPSDDDMGNSEVGHNALGCGQIYSQGAKLVNESIESGKMYESTAWKEEIDNVKKNNSTLHFIGLLSDGNVHSNIKHLITKKSRFVYDKNAQCPTWNIFLQRIFNKDAALIRFIQKAMGYALSGDVSEQCLFILWGTGANGKSTFLNVLQYLFGDYACSTMIETFLKKNSEQSNDLARLKGARLVTTTEVEQGKALSESIIKQITGEDILTARFLYSEYFSFKPTFKIFMATNHKPKIKGADNGIWRRIKMIPFTVTIPPEQRDKKLSEKLMAENSGILNWLLRGYAMWAKEGLGEPAAVKEANEEYRMDMDSVGTFVNECLNIDAGLSWRLPNKLMYETYLKWCNRSNERVMSQKWLSIQLQEKGFKRCVSNGMRFWLGLGVKENWLK